MHSPNSVLLRFLRLYQCSTRTLEDHFDTSQLRHTDLTYVQDLSNRVLSLMLRLVLPLMAAFLNSNHLPSGVYHLCGFWKKRFLCLQLYFNMLWLASFLHVVLVWIRFTSSFLT
ncbi:hypothetical protein M5K25_006594 [Dendrobium thyrsiflorum]|uniref:Uncharacterized protein n=1 Tax=Dendrobium thyrsiflorum TaxID=117978 RepID=A0ABD0VD84_DENTH